jgi:phosphoribosyl-ATP pyrophosphohydrolase
LTPASQPLDKLERTIADRAANPKENSYTSQLLAGGVAKIGAKVIEEAAEVVEAAGKKGKAGKAHFVREVGDLVYHLLVLMQHQGCTLAHLETELSRRFGVSGLDEKAARKPKKGARAKSVAQEPSESPPYM